MKTSEAAAALGSRGGKATTEAKAAAARRNLKKARKARWPTPKEKG